MSALRGTKQTPNHIQKRIESRKKNGNFECSETTREKMRERAKGNHSHLGKYHSEETKKRLREITKKQWENGQFGRREKSHAWKGGKCSEEKIIRCSIEYHLWREAVWARDNWTCQKTRIRGKDLEAHHINNFAEFPELRTSIENGITLSEKAHKEFHKKYGRKNNTKEQLQEFLKNV